MRSAARVAPATSIKSEVHLALTVPVWAARFFLHHAGLILTISLVAAAQRAVSQLWGDQLPGGISLIGEIVTAAARILLFVIVFYLAIAAEEKLQGVDGKEAARRAGRFARDHWRSLLVQVGLLLLAVIIFDRIPEAVIAPRISEEAQPIYWASLLAVKNLTIIPFTLIWQIGILRQMVLTNGDALSR